MSATGSTPAPRDAPRPAPRPLPRTERWGALLVISALGVAALRQAGEVIVGVAWPEAPVFQNFAVFYLVSALAVLAVLRAGTGRSVQELAGFVSLGMLVGVLPPVLDGLLFQEGKSRYVYFEGFRWLFTSPEQPRGETVTIWIALLGLGIFTAWVSRRAAPAVGVWIGGYLAMQLVGGGLPALVHALLPGPRTPRGILHHVLMLSLAFGILAALRPRAFGYSLGRLNHTLPFGCATAIGARLAGDAWRVAGVKAALVLLASALVVAANDWYDREQDAAVGKARAMGPEDAWLVTAMQLLLCGSVAWFLREALAGIALLTAVTLAYHHPATRLKRFLGAGYVIEGLAALACFLVGAVRPAPGAPFLPATAEVGFGLALAPVGFLLGSLVKDYKDVEADARAGIATIYTALASRGVAPARTHRLVAAVLLACLVASTVLVSVAGAPAAAVGLLAALTVLAGASLLGGTPAASVERTVWVVSAHLLVTALALPAPLAR